MKELMKMLRIDEDTDSYRFYKTLQEDIYLKPDEYNRWDMQFENGDLINLTGHESLRNGICIAIMTRLQELHHNKLYSDFGCRVHELIKANKSNMVQFKIELFIRDTLENMRRVKDIEELTVIDNPHDEYSNYEVFFHIRSISDELVKGKVIF